MTLAELWKFYATKRDYWHGYHDAIEHRQPASNRAEYAAGYRRGLLDREGVSSDA